jgi:hypothetical protein
MSLMHKIRSWWNKDRTEIAEQEAGMTQAERDVADEDFEGRKDDVKVRQGGWDSGAGAGGIDFERDSSGPPKY